MSCCAWLIDFVVYFTLEACFLEAWINEPALHDRYWTETWTSLPVPPIQGLTASKATRVNMTSRVVNANKAFLRHFIAIPVEELVHLGFSSFSRLCYVLVSQVKAALALLDAARIGPPSNPASLADFGTKTQTPAQLVTKEVDYVNECTVLYRQLKSACRASHELTHELACREHFACFVKGMIASYEHHVGGRSAPALDATAQYPQLMVNTGNPPGMYAGMPDLGSDTSLDGQSTIVEDFVFDDAVWQSVMDTFSMQV